MKRRGRERGRKEGEGGKEGGRRERERGREEGEGGREEGEGGRGGEGGRKEGGRGRERGREERREGGEEGGREERKGGRRGRRQERKRGKESHFTLPSTSIGLTGVIYGGLEKLSTKLHQDLSSPTVVNGQVHLAQKGRGRFQFQELVKGMGELNDHQEVGESIRRKADPSQEGEEGERGRLSYLKVLCWTFELFCLLHV